MSDPQPSRRRSSSSPSRSSTGGSGGGGPLPMAALVIGVIVAGLGIGALVSAFQSRESTAPELGATSVPAVTPVPQPSGPQPLITRAPAPVPSPTPMPTVSPSPSPSPSASPAAAPTARPSASPSPHPTATPSPMPTASPMPRATAAVHATPAPAKPAVAVMPPSPPPSPPPPARPAVQATARPATPNPADAAAGVVRRYIGDLIAGDEAGAYAALGGNRNLDLKEEAFLDKDARITSMHVNLDATGATVDTEITANSGQYAATFHVTNGPNGSIITSHDYIKI